MAYSTGPSAETTIVVEISEPALKSAAAAAASSVVRRLSGAAATASAAFTVAASAGASSSAAAASAAPFTPIRSRDDWSRGGASAVGCCTGRYTAPEIPGTWMLEVMVGDAHAQGSPFTVTVETPTNDAEAGADADADANAAEETAAHLRHETDQGWKDKSSRAGKERGC